MALRYRFHGRLFEVGGQCRQIVGELQQQRQLVLTLDVGEVGDHLGQGGRHAHTEPGTGPGSSPATIGTRTVLPHSVQEPS